jgi:hypothetical protein
MIDDDGGDLGEIGSIRGRYAGPHVGLRTNDAVFRPGAENRADHLI